MPVQRLKSLELDEKPTFPLDKLRKLSIAVQEIVAA